MKRQNLSVVVAAVISALTGMASAARIVELSDGWEFRREGGAWERVRVPHDWAISGPFDKEIDKQVVAIVENGEKTAKEKTGRTGSLPFIGKGEYRTMVTIPEGTGYAALVFDAVMSEPEVFCDGRKVGEWKHGYNAFEVELPAEAGTHEIVVRATNRPESSRWYPGAGIIRPVKLVLGGVVGVKTWGTAVWCPDLKTVKVTAECRGEIGKVKYRLLDGGREVAASETGTLTGDFEPWSPENPKLYTLVTEAYAKDGALADRKEERIGVRTLKFGDGKFLLNGKARKFKGVCLHHDLGPLGAAFDKDAFRRQMTLLKEMGCDSLRTSHNMPSEGQLEVCDELGVLVMAESFDSWHIAKVKNGYNLFFDDWWKRDIRNLVEKCRNHPSVVMWSIGNEVYEQNEDNGAGLARALQAECHRYDPDPTRRVTQGLSWMPNAIEKGLNAVMDIPAVTYRLPFYEAMYRDTKTGIVLGAETASTISSRGVYFFPVVETNYPAHANLQCSSYDVEWTPWSNLPDDDWAMQDDHPWTIGEFVWTGFDYLGEPFPYDASWPSRSAYFGIFDLAGIPKDRYWLYRSHWNTTSHTLHLVPHWTFPDRVGKVTPVYCYTDFDEAELFLNGKSQGRRRKDPKTRLDRYRLRWNDVVYEPGELKVVAYGTDGKPAMTEIVRTASSPARVELEKRRFGRLLFVTAKIVDKDGTLVPDADDELSFAGGEGLRFKAVCNGDATSLESFVVPHMRAFHGQLVAIFEGEGEDCKVTFRAR